MVFWVKWIQKDNVVIEKIRGKLQTKDKQEGKIEDKIQFISFHNLNTRIIWIFIANYSTYHLNYAKNHPQITY
jgi:hypothetical protein